MADSRARDVSMLDSVINKAVRQCGLRRGATLLCKLTDCEYPLAVGASTDEIVTAAAAIPRSGPRQSLPINGSPLSRRLRPRPAETGHDAPVADSTVREGL